MAVVYSKHCQLNPVLFIWGRNGRVIYQVRNTDTGVLSGVQIWSGFSITTTQLFMELLGGFFLLLSFVSVCCYLSVWLALGAELEPGVSPLLRYSPA